MAAGGKGMSRSASQLLLETVNGFLGNAGGWQPVLAIIKGLRNGAVYGAKIRFPHALVMTLLFKDAPITEQARAIFEATFQHSKNLATFVVGYKTLQAIFRKLDSKPHQYHDFLSAFIVGYYVWGQNNKINEQINLYLLSRVVYALVRLAADSGYIPKPKSDAFPWFSALMWGFSLWLFEHHKRYLQGSLQSSMTYLYHDSNVWHNLRDFLLYNK